MIFLPQYMWAENQNTVLYDTFGFQEFITFWFRYFCWNYYRTFLILEPNVIFFCSDSVQVSSIFFTQNIKPFSMAYL